MDVDAASYSAATFSKPKGFLQVTGVVLTPGSVADAKKVFTVARKQRDAFWRFTRDAKRIDFSPKYGSHQFAR